MVIMPELEAFATPQDMSDRTAGEITTTSHPFLEAELKAASDAIRRECGWHIAPAETLEYKRRFADPERVWLPATQVSSVGPATIDGVSYTSDDIEYDPVTGWTNMVGRNVTVTYLAGYEEPPADLVSLTLEIAATALGTSLGFARQQAGSVSVTFDRAGGGIGANSERLSPYRLGWLP